MRNVVAIENPLSQSLSIMRRRFSARCSTRRSSTSLAARRPCRSSNPPACTAPRRASPTSTTPRHSARRPILARAGAERSPYLSRRVSRDRAPARRESADEQNAEAVVLVGRGSPRRGTRWRIRKICQGLRRRGEVSFAARSSELRSGRAHDRQRLRSGFSIATTFRIGASARGAGGREWPGSVEAPAGDLRQAAGRPAASSRRARQALARALRRPVAPLRGGSVRGQASRPSSVDLLRSGRPAG